MNQIIEQVCQRRCVPPEKFFGPAKGAQVVAARKEAIERLQKAGLGPQKIADETDLHVQTVYYWLRPQRRERVRRQSAESFRLHQKKMRDIGGPRQSKAQRQEIIDAYLEDPAKGTALACSRGLAPLYAYKLVHALGLLPRKEEQ